LKSLDILVAGGPPFEPEYYKDFEGEINQNLGKFFRFSTIFLVD
jgi:hypothetical protein